MKIKSGALMIIAGLLLSSCLISELPQKTISNSGDNPSVIGELFDLDEKNGDWLKLTTEQKLEDFDFLYNQLIENYPYIDMLARTQSINFDEIYQDYRTKLLNSTTDFQFFAILQMFTEKLDNTGHLSLVSPIEISWYQGAYKNVDNMTKEEAIRARLLDSAYNAAKVSKSYESMSERFFKVFNEVQTFYKNKRAQSETNVEKDTTEKKQIYQNVEKSILQDNEIAYIKINSFSNEYYNNDKKILFDFYESVANYENIIIDITHNGGGAMSYFDNLIVAPNISSPLSMDAYELTKEGKINKKYLGLSQYRPIEELPKLPDLNNTDIKNLSCFKHLQYIIEPLYAKKILNGKIWLLVGNNVYSSSEYAALFSKATGFATLVGSVTAGDGIGEDPLPITLPNSNLLVLYSSVYGITGSGVCSAEKGTEPDIYTVGDMTPLDKCLQTIAEQ